MDGISLLPVIKGEMGDAERPLPLAFQDRKQIALSELQPAL